MPLKGARAHGQRTDGARQLEQLATDMAILGKSEIEATNDLHRSRGDIIHDLPFVVNESKKYLEKSARHSKAVQMHSRKIDELEQDSARLRKLIGSAKLNEFLQSDAINQLEERLKAARGNMYDIASKLFGSEGVLDFDRTVPQQDPGRSQQETILSQYQPWFPPPNVSNLIELLGEQHAQALSTGLTSNMLFQRIQDLSGIVQRLAQEGLEKNKTKEKDIAQIEKLKQDLALERGRVEQAVEDLQQMDQRRATAEAESVKFEGFFLEGEANTEHAIAEMKKEKGAMREARDAADESRYQAEMALQTLQRNAGGTLARISEDNRSLETENDELKKDLAEQTRNAADLSDRLTRSEEKVEKLTNDLANLTTGADVQERLKREIDRVNDKWKDSYLRGVEEKEKHSKEVNKAQRATIRTIRKCLNDVVLDTHERGDASTMDLLEFLQMPREAPAKDRQLTKKVYLVDNYAIGRSEENADVSATAMRSDLSIGRLFQVVFSQEDHESGSLLGLCESQILLDEAIQKLLDTTVEDDMLQVYFPLMMWWTDQFVADRKNTLQSCIAVGMFIQLVDLYERKRFGKGMRNISSMLRGAGRGYLGTLVATRALKHVKVANIHHNVEFRMVKELDPDQNILQAILTHKDHPSARDAKICTVVVRPDLTLVLLQQDGFHDELAFIQKPDQSVTLWQGVWSAEVNEDGNWVLGMDPSPIGTDVIRPWMARV